MKVTFALTFALAVAQHAFSQNFTKITPQGAVGLNYSHNAWFDFDNDGDLDIIVNGAISTNDMQTAVYRNNGNDAFALLNSVPALPPYGESEIAFINLDGDARIDVLLMGRKSGTDPRISQLKNTPTGFTDLGTIADFGQPQGGATIAVGDVNNDGTQDVFMSSIVNFDNGEPVIKAVLYTRKGNVYTPTENSFIPIYLGTAQFADLENDEDLDLIVSGNDGTYPYQSTRIYYNDGTGVFTEAEEPLAQLQNTSIDIADYDGDRDLDILLTGLDENLESVTKLYYEGAGTYHELPLPESINRTASGSAKFADFDNDGDPDIVITGTIGDDENQNRKLALYENDGGLYYEIEDPALELISIGEASWGDYDNDGDLDILVTGCMKTQPDLLGTLYILKNNSASKNVKPTAPTEFSVSPVGSNSASLFWDGSEDDHTPNNSLTYNLSLKNAEGAYLLHPFSDDVTGKRNIMEQGNMWTNFGWHINDLENGTWLFKVQAIDASFGASAWSDTKKFYAGNPLAPTNLAMSYATGDISLTWDDNSNNEETFVIERRIGDGSFLKLGEVVSNVKTFVDEDLTTEGVYQYRVYAKNPNNNSSRSNTVSFTFVGFEDNFLTSAAVYPNPAKDKIFIVAKDLSNSVATVMFMDTKGVIHKNTLLRFNHDGEGVIEVSGMTAGIYVMRIGKRVVKLVKE